MHNFRSNLQHHRRVQAEDVGQSGHLEIAVVVALLQRMGITCTDDDILMMLQRFKHPSSATLVMYRRMLAALEVEPPKGYIDPERHGSSLPHPYGAVADIVESLLDRAWANIQKGLRNPDLRQYRASQGVKRLQTPETTLLADSTAVVSVARDCLLRVHPDGLLRVSATSPAATGAPPTFPLFPQGGAVPFIDAPYQLFGGQGEQAVWSPAENTWRALQQGWASGSVQYGAVHAACPTAPAPAADHYRSPTMVDDVLEICDAVFSGAGGGGVSGAGFPAALQSVALLDGLLGREKASRCMKPATIAPPVVLWPRDPSQRGVLWVGACSLVDGSGAVLGSELRWFHISSSALQGDIEDASMLGTPSASIAQQLQDELSSENADVGRVEELAAALASCPGDGMWPNTVCGPVRWLAYARIPTVPVTLEISPDGRFTSMVCQQLPSARGLTETQHSRTLSQLMATCVWCFHHHPAVFAPPAALPQPDGAVQQVQAAQSALMGSDSDSDSEEGDSGDDASVDSAQGFGASTPFFRTRDLLGEAPPPAPLRPAALPVALCVVPPELQAHVAQLESQLQHDLSALDTAAAADRGSKRSASSVPRGAAASGAPQHETPVLLPTPSHCHFLMQCDVMSGGAIDAAVSSAWESSASGLGRGLLAAFGGEDEDDLDISGGASSLGQSTVLSGRSSRSSRSHASASTARSAAGAFSTRELARAGNTGHFHGAHGHALQPPVNTPGLDGSPVATGILVAWAGAGADSSSSVRRFTLPWGMLCPQLPPDGGTPQRLHSMAQHWSTAQVWRVDGWLWAWPWRACVLSHLVQGSVAQLETDPSTQPSLENAKQAVQAYFNGVSLGCKVPSIQHEQGLATSNALQSPLPVCPPCSSQLYVPGGVSAMATDSQQPPGAMTGLASGASTLLGVGSMDGSVLAVEPVSLSIAGSLQAFSRQHSQAVAVTALGFSPDARWLAAGSEGGMLHLYDLHCAHAPVGEYGHAFIQSAMLQQAAQAEKEQASMGHNTSGASLPSYMKATSSRKQQVKSDTAKAQRRSAASRTLSLDLHATSSRAFGGQPPQKWGILQGSASPAFAQSLLDKALSSGADLASAVHAARFRGSLVAARRDTEGCITAVHMIQKPLQPPNDPVGLWGATMEPVAAGGGASVSFSRAPSTTHPRHAAAANATAPTIAPLPLLVTTCVPSSVSPASRAEVLLHDVQAGRLLAVSSLPGAHAQDVPVSIACGIVCEPQSQLEPLQYLSMEQLVECHVPAAVGAASNPFAGAAGPHAGTLMRFSTLTPAQRNADTASNSLMSQPAHPLAAAPRGGASRQGTRSSSRKSLRANHGAVESKDGMEATLPALLGGGISASGPARTAACRGRPDATVRKHVSEYAAARGTCRAEREERQHVRVHALRTVLKNN